MPSKKKKYNARFPPARIKKIMQMDEEVGKVAATVPVIISRALELFIESLIQQATQMTLSKNAKTLSASHLKHIIESEERYHFLKELVANISDYQVEEDGAPSINHLNTEEDSAATALMAKKTRGRPRKAKDTNQVTQKKDRRKKKKESSSSESENSEDTDDADEGSDEESMVPAASSAPVAAAIASSTFSTENLPSSSSASDCTAAYNAPATTTTTLTHQPLISELLLGQSRKQQPATSAQLQDAASLPLDYSQALQHQQQQVALPAVSLEGSVHDLSNFQSVNAIYDMFRLPVSASLPMYQTMPGMPATPTAAAPHLFWPGPARMLASPGPGFPSLSTQGFAAAGLGQPQVPPGFPGMLLPGLGLPTLSPSLMSLQGMPGVPFPGLSPLAAAGFAGMSMAGTALAGMPSVAAAPAATAMNGAQADDDYDT